MNAWSEVHPRSTGAVSTLIFLGSGDLRATLRVWHNHGEGIARSVVEFEHRTLALRAASEAATFAAYAYRRAAELLELGERYEINIVASEVDRGIVYIGEGDLQLLADYFSIVIRPQEPAR